MQQYFDTNKLLWNEKTPVHLQSKMYDMEAFLAGKNSMDSIVTNKLEDVKGKSVLHLQCHFGQDSLSLARMGAKVTGVDFSDVAIQVARQLNDQLGLDATFVECNVFDLEQHLEGEFDIVFASYGFLPWLPDFYKWVAIANHFLKKGGRMYLTEFHPVVNMFDWDNPKPAYDYFHKETPFEEEVIGTYADASADIRSKEFFWNYSIHEVIMPLLKAGLTLVDIEEYDYSPYNIFGENADKGTGQYRLGDFPCSFPHVYSLIFQK